MTTEDTDELQITASWPASTLGGVPAVVSGDLQVSKDPDGSGMLSGAVGPTGAPPEECEYFEFVLSPNDVRAIADLFGRGSGDLDAAGLAAVPVGAVVRSSEGTIAARFDCELGVLFGDDRPFHWADLRPPATLLWKPSSTPQPDEHL